MEREISLAWHTTKTIVDQIFSHLPNLIIGIIVYSILANLSGIVRKTIWRVGDHAKLDITLAHTLGTLASAALMVLAILIAAVIIVPGFKVSHIITGLGLTSLAAGFAFKDILENFFAGLLLLWQKPFHIGDIIQTGTFEGSIKEIRIISTHLRADNGDLVILPNSVIFSQGIVVKTASNNRRFEITVTGSPNRSVEANRKIIKQIIDSTEGIGHTPAPEILLVDINGGEQHFKIQFWTDSTPAIAARAIDQINTRIREAMYQSPQHSI